MDKYNMKAVSKYMEIDVVKADKYIKRVIPNAEYMARYKGFTFTFVPYEIGEYVINGNPYHLISTNPYDCLIEHFVREQQPTIFDFLE